MRLISPVLAFVFLISVLSCKKNNTNTAQNYNWIRFDSAILYASDSVTETFKDVYSYDNQGRYTGESIYNNEVITSVSRNYAYNGNEATYYFDSYLYGNLARTRLHKVDYLNNLTQYSAYITYNSDGVTEASRDTITYDTQGRIIGTEFYQNGILQKKNRAYTYTGNQAIYFTDVYSNGSVTGTTMYKEAYRSNFILFDSLITYAADGVTETEKQVDTYDSQGRPTGWAIYRNGLPWVIARSYSYSGNVATLYQDYYTNGSITSTIKEVDTYHNM